MISKPTVKRLQSLVTSIQVEIDQAGFGRIPLKDTAIGDTPLGLFDRLIMDEAIRSATRELFKDGYYALAVEECCKCLANSVKERSGKGDKDGTDLMFTVFNEDKPVLALNKLRTTSEKDEQRGYKFMYVGMMCGIRNPRVHEHEYLDDAHIALEMIAFAQHLMHKLKSTRKCRKKKV